MPQLRNKIQRRKSKSDLRNQEGVAFKMELNEVAGFQQSRQRKEHEEETKSPEGGSHQGTASIWFRLQGMIAQRSLP